MENYVIVLFKNKIKKRIIKKFVTLEKAYSFFQNIIKSNDNVIFEKKIENGQDCNFEVGLLKKGKNESEQIYKTDELGRNLKIRVEDEMSFIQLESYKIDEKIFDLQKDKRIKITELIESYLNNNNIKMFSNLNNKIILQIEESVYIFSTKDEFESIRFLDSLSNYFYKTKRNDCIFVKTISSAQKKYLMKFLKEKNIEEKILYRKFTTYPRSK